MTLAETFDTHIKAISTAEEWEQYKAMVEQPSVYDFVIDKIRVVGEPKFLIQNNKAMKYKTLTHFHDIPRGIEIEADSDVYADNIIYDFKNDTWKANPKFLASNDHLFEPVEQVQEGDYWHFIKSNHIVRIDRIRDDKCEVVYIDNNQRGQWFISEIANRAVKLSTHEVEQALIKEAKRRGYGSGVKINNGSLYDHNVSDGEYVISNNPEYRYIEERDYLDVCTDTFRASIYKKGTWASIVDQTPHIEINGKQIEVEDGTVKISCGDTIEEDMFKNFYAVVNKYNLDVSRNGEDINEQLRQIWDEMPNKVGETVSWSIEIDGSEIDWSTTSRSNIKL